MHLLDRCKAEIRQRTKTRLFLSVAFLRTSTIVLERLWRGYDGLSNLSFSFFKSMLIPVPPPEEQAAIARILDAVDTAVERTRETLQSVDVFRV